MNIKTVKIKHAIFYLFNVINAQKNIMNVAQLIVQTLLNCQKKNKKNYLKVEKLNLLLKNQIGLNLNYMNWINK